FRALLTEESNSNILKAGSIILLHLPLVRSYLLCTRFNETLLVALEKGITVHGFPDKSDAIFRRIFRRRLSLVMAMVSIRIWLPFFAIPLANLTPRQGSYLVEIIEKRC
ncbi:hypothetical protein, partial [Mesotoga prima]|uniref:hypothetical protein n=1 Tax=Mesotoga prima TaxID=1184387 RepID=UPI002FD999E5